MGRKQLIASTPAARGLPGAQSERQADGAALAEASDHGLLPGDAALAQEAVDEPGRQVHAGEKGLLVGVADLADHVPVAPAGRDVGERRPGRQADEAALGVERVEQGVEVVLVDAAPVEQDQGALGLARWLADPVDQLSRCAAAVHAANAIPSGAAPPRGG